MEELRQIDSELVQLNARRRELEQKRQKAVDQTIENLLSELESLGINRSYISNYINNSVDANEVQSS
ncbi:MAG: hypothetical protein AB4040_02025 [Synechococcus sp.]